MRATAKLKINWIKLALGMYLATLTNHSRGEVVYRKFSTIALENQARKTETTPPPASDHSEALEVKRVSKGPAGLSVLLNGGSRDGFLKGTVLESKRAQGSRTIPTGLLKIVEVFEDFSLAEVTVDGSEVAAMHFPDLPGVMVGDRVEAQEIVVAQTLRILPTRSLPFDRLFVDPKGLPSTFELTPEGRNTLLEAARVFVDAHSPLLLIEGYTDHKGDRQTNQIESYQRALTIRQVLIDELGFDPERLVAIGLGESEPLEEPYLPGREREARRIVLRVKDSKTSP